MTAVPPEADRERLGAELAEQFSEWASREGLLARVTEEQCADLAKAYIAGALSAAVISWEPFSARLTRGLGHLTQGVPRG